MDIGIGIPNTVPGTTGAQLLEWARKAEEAGFSSLATIGAVDYPGYEELTVFAAAAAVTERIRFLPNVLIAPARSAAELAKQAATVDQLSGGRLTLGLAVGWRPGDFSLTGRDFDSRGDRFDEMLTDLGKAWAGQPLTDGTGPVSPPPTQEGGVPILIGGQTEAAIRRTVEHGTGWTAGGMPPDAVAQQVARVRRAWAAAGRDGAPRINALAYFGLGGVDPAPYIGSYYAALGAETVGYIASNVLRTPDAVRGALEAYEQAGVDELVFDPTVSDPGQVDLLAEIVF